MTRSKLAPLPCAIFTSEQTITWFERRLLGSPTGPDTSRLREAKQLRRTKMLPRSVAATVRRKPTRKRWRCSTRTASPKTNRLFIVIFPTAPIQELIKQRVAMPAMRNARMFQKWPVTCDRPCRSPRSLHCQGFGVARCCSPSDELAVAREVEGLRRVILVRRSVSFSRVSACSCIPGFLIDLCRERWLLR